MKMQVGDVVHVRGKIIADGLDGPHVRFAGGDRANVAYGDIVHVEPRALQVGDKVTQRGYHANDPGVIAAIDEGRAWVRLTPPVSGQLHYSDRVSNLVRA